MSEAGILAEIERACAANRQWQPLSAFLDDSSVGVHLAVMVEPFLTFLLDGRKTIESRFAKNAITPFRRIHEGDLVLLKAGPVVGSFRASSARFFNLADGDLTRIRRDFGDQICAFTDDFWQARADKRYATLIGVADVRVLPPVIVPKRDMRGWVVIRPSQQPELVAV